MLKGLRGDDEVIKFIQTDVGEKVRVISVGPNSLSLEQDFQDRLIAATIIQSRFDLVGLKKVNFFLKHLHIAFALEAVFMLQVAFDLFVFGNMELCRNGYCPTL